MTKAGIVRAEGDVITSVSSTSRIVVQIPPSETDSGQYEPRQITVGNLLSGGGTSFTQGSVIFAGASGDLDEDNVDFNYNTTISGALFSANGFGMTQESGTGRVGTATLTSGTVTVSNDLVTANSRIFLTRYDPDTSTALGVLSVGTVTPTTSFVINSLDPADATVETNDVSVVHWMIIEPLVIPD